MLWNSIARLSLEKNIPEWLPASYLLDFAFYPFSLHCLWNSSLSRNDLYLCPWIAFAFFLPIVAKLIHRTLPCYLSSSSFLFSPDVWQSNLSQRDLRRSPKSPKCNQLETEGICFEWSSPIKRAEAWYLIGALKGGYFSDYLLIPISFLKASFGSGISKDYWIISV